MRQLFRELRSSLRFRWTITPSADRASILLALLVLIGIALAIPTDGDLVGRVGAILIVAAALALGTAAMTRAKMRRAMSSGPRTATDGDVRVRGMLATDGPSAAQTLDDVVARSNGWPEAALNGWIDTFRQLPSAGLPFGAVSGLFVIESVSDSGILGVISIQRDGVHPYDPSIGFWLGPHARGAGLGVKAMTAFLSLIGGAGIDSLYLGTDTENTAMRRVAIGAGGIEHDIRPQLLPNGTEVESVWYRFRAQPIIDAAARHP